MQHTLSKTPVALHAKEIFGDICPGTVLVLKADTGSGKSLVSPVALYTVLNGPIIVFVPSVDVAKKNAELIAKLSGLGWELGREVGYCAGGEFVNGLNVMIVTYGAFIARKKLQQRHWLGYILDECHVEQWQVEVVRADIHDALERNENIAVIEASATLDGPKLVRYWETVGNNVDVQYYEIEGAGTPFQRELIEVPTYGSHNFAEGKVCAKETIRRLQAGDRFIMVTQPGQADVEECAELIFRALKQDRQLPDTEVFVYHGDTDREEVEEMLGELDPFVRRVIVATPRLLTGMNLKNLDTVVTDGLAKYPESDQNGNSALLKKEMSQTELRQALGRIGRFKDGRLILCSDWGMAERLTVMVPEVQRLSSLPLALGLVSLGRNPLEVKFCNQPKDLPGSMARLREWGFVDEDDVITDIGTLAHVLEIRPDVANFLTGVWFDFDVDIETLATAVIIAAVMESGGITMRRRVDKNGKPISPPTLNVTSDTFNEAMRFMEVLQWDKERVKKASWVSKQGLSRTKGWVYRLLGKMNDEALNQYFERIFEKDIVVKTSKNKTSKTSPSMDAWRTIAGQLSHTFTQHKPILLRHLIRTMGSKKLNKAMPWGRGRCDGVDINRNSIAVDNRSAVALQGNALFLANTFTIDPRDGDAFDILKDVVHVTMEDLVDALPDVFTIEQRQLQEMFGRRNMARTLLVNNIDFVSDERWTDAEEAAAADIAALFDNTASEA